MWHYKIISLVSQFSRQLIIILVVLFFKHFCYIVYLLGLVCVCVCVHYNSFVEVKLVLNLYHVGPKIKFRPGGKQIYLQAL